MATLNSACCALPAVTTHNYIPQGHHETIAGLDVYITGSSVSHRAILAIYDVFGPVPQTLQGADRLATASGALVLMPDFFRGEPLPLTLYPPDTDAKMAAAKTFLAGRGDAGANLRKAMEVVGEAGGKWGGRRWGGYGLCWGGKLIAMASGAGTPFVASGQAHPGRLATEDAEEMTIPHICLFSKEDGAPELVEEYGRVLGRGVGNVVERYESMPHGWMGARADFENQEAVREFERGYTQLADFFVKNL